MIDEMQNTINDQTAKITALKKQLITQSNI